MIKVLYIGIDDAYFTNLQKHFKRKFESEQFEFLKLWHKEPDTFQQIVLKIIEEQADVTFLDYSASPLKMLTLARSLPRILQRGAGLIGLWDYLAEAQLIRESNTTGVPFNHIKSGEFGDLVVQAMFLVKKEEESFPRDLYVKAEISEEPMFLQASHAMRIGFLTKDYIHIEHDITLPDSAVFELRGEFGSKFPIKKYKMLRRLDQNYYYNFSYVSDLEFVKDVIINPKEEEESEVDRKWRMSEMQEMTELNHKRIDKFVKDNSELNLPKRTRVLVIDPKLTLLSDAEKPIDSYSHSIRFIRSVVDNDTMMGRTRAGIVCFCCVDRGDGELNEMMSTLSSIINYRPFVLVYGTNHTSDHLRKHFSYDRIMSNSEDFSLPQLITFCDMFNSKGGKEKANEGLKSYHSDEERVYLDKNSVESFLHFHFHIELRELTESWFTFQTSVELPLWGIFELDEPVPMRFTIVEELDEKEWLAPGFFQYLAISHCVGETDKSELRRQVNQIIYEQAHAEEEREKLKQAEEDKKLKEEQLKAKAEADEAESGKEKSEPDDKEDNKE